MNDKALEDAVRKDLDLDEINSTGISGEGKICSGFAYDTDKYGRVYIKVNSKSGAKTMFDGEYASLEALHRLNIMRLPKPIKVVDIPGGGGSALVMEFIDMGGKLSKHSAVLGDQLARLHLHNASMKEKTIRTASSVHQDNSGLEYVGQFGFPITTCCGFFGMDNTWKDDWMDKHNAETQDSRVLPGYVPGFYASRIETQIKLLEEKKGDRQARELWNKIVPKMSRFFDGIDIEPALLHGDFHINNIAENDDGPVTFDPACFYGHSEFDLAIGLLFGGFSSDFYAAYHKMIPKAPGFEKRKDLYILYNNINHWNHFDGKYIKSSFSSLQTCVEHLYS